MAESNANPPDILKEAREWLRLRDERRQLLEAELERAEARAAEIRSVLAELGSAPVEPEMVPSAPPVTKLRAPPVVKLPAQPVMKLKLPKGGEGVARRTFVHATVAEAIEAVVRKSPGITSGQIVKGVLAIKPDAKPTTIFPTIYRMRDRGHLAEADEKYYPPGAAPAEEEAASK
jgi:hypothetical protein